MVADISDPKNIGIGAVLYLFFMLVLWKFQLGTTGSMDLTSLKIIISIIFLPICFGIIYLMGDDW